MSRFKRAVTTLFFALAIGAGAAPLPAFANDDKSERPPLAPSASAAPIGVVDAFGGATIDGRAVQGRREIWGGELIQARAGTSLRAQLNAVGQVTLTPESIARFATAAATSHPGDERRILIISLLSGEIKAELKPEATAYIEAREKAFTASAGAGFRIAIREGEVEVETESGYLRQQNKPDECRKKKLELCDFRNRVSCPTPKPEEFNTNAKSRIGVQAKESYTKSPACAPPTHDAFTLNSSFSTGRTGAYDQLPAPHGPNVGFDAARLPNLFIENQGAPADIPLAGEWLIIELDPGLGSITQCRNQPGDQCRVLTNSVGIAHLTLETGSTDKSTGKLTAKIERTCKKDTSEKKDAGEQEPCVSQSWEITLHSPIFTPKIKFLTGAAAGVGLGIIIPKVVDRKEIKPLPPPVITP
jgi:hypothetical protein